MKANKHLAIVMAATMVAGSVVPVMAETTNEALIGKNRIETAVKISKDGWNSAETVILVNDGAIADALTATPLAFAKNAPILLTSKNGLSAQVKAEIKRLDAKNVILIGGNTVLPASIEKELKELGLKPDRIKGDTREETALAIAKRLDAISDVSEIAVVNGTKGLADAVSVAAAAAERHMPILLANPKKGLSASEKFIKDEAIKASYLIGGTTVLPNKMVSSLPGKKRLEGSNRNDTNAKVIETFYKGKELKNVYVAKDGRGGDSQLIDALAVGVLAAKNASPVLIASKNLNAKQVNVINTKEVSNIVQVGGKGNEGAFNQLKEIEKEDVYEVETVEELKEALAKADANDKIVLKPNATITEDIIINTDKNVDIKVEGTVTGKVEITAPNGNVVNNSTSKPSTGGSNGGSVTPSDTVAPEIAEGKSVTVDFTKVKGVNVVPNGTVEFDTSDPVESIKIEMNESVKVVGNVKVNNGTEEFGTVKVDTDGKTLVITPNDESKKVTAKEYDFKIVSDDSNYIADTSGNKLAKDTSISLTFVNAENIAVVSDKKSLEEALKKAEITTIKLNSGITIDNNIVIPRNMTIDLNDNFIKQTQSKEDGGDIIVIDTDNIELNLKNGKLIHTDKTPAKEEGDTSYGNHAGVFVMKNRKDVTVNMYKVDVKMGGFNFTEVGKCDYANLFGIYVNGTCKNALVNIDKCNVSGAAVGVYFPAGSSNEGENSSINIRNSNITGGAAVGIKGGICEISNSELVGTGLTSDEYINTIEPSSGGIAEAGEALCIEGSYNDRGINVVVKESDLLRKNGYGIRMQFFNGEHAKTLTFESGTVSGKLGSVFKNFRDLTVNHSNGKKTEYKRNKEIKIFNKSFITKGGTFTPEFSKPEETNPTV